jgi:hypothetical protein
MGLEAATYINQLNALNPVGAVDPKAQGDDHLRLIKSTLQASFPNITGAMTATQAQLNQWAGLAGAYNWSGQHRWADGSLASPAISFVSDTNTGLYKFASDAIGFSVGGIFAGTFAIDGSGGAALYMPSGTVALPAISFSGDGNTGVYRKGADRISIAAGGVDIIDADRGGTNTVAINLPTLFADGAIGGPAISFSSDSDTGFYRIGGNNIGVVSGSALALDITNARILFPDGVVGSPSHSFINDPDSGMYSGGANNLRFSTGGVKGLEIDSAHKLYDQNNFELGYKQVPRSTTVTTLAASDVAKCVAITAAINIPASVFSAGDAISIYNDSAGALNITISAGTLRLAGTTTTGTRSLAARGMATLWFNVGGATPEVIASGNVT